MVIIKASPQPNRTDRTEPARDESTELQEEKMLDSKFKVVLESAARQVAVANTMRELVNAKKSSESDESHGLVDGEEPFGTTIENVVSGSRAGEAPEHAATGGVTEKILKEERPSSQEKQLHSNFKAVLDSDAWQMEVVNTMRKLVDSKKSSESDESHGLVDGKETFGATVEK